jgi:hypothetical protein
MGQQQTVTVAGSAVRRTILLATVVALMLAMLAVPAFAAPGAPNSENAGPPSQGEFNFGHCQSKTAKAAGSAKEAQDANPAIYTAGQDVGTGTTCA